jgi:hypothetical protein
MLVGDKETIDERLRTAKVHMVPSSKPLVGKTALITFVFAGKIYLELAYSNILQEPVYIFAHLLPNYSRLHSLRLLL